MQQNYRKCNYCGCKTTAFTCASCKEKLPIVKDIIKIGKSILANETVKNTQNNSKNFV